MDVLVAVFSICASLLSIVSIIVGAKNSSRIKKLEDRSISVERVKIVGRGNSQIIGHGNSVNGHERF